MDFTIKTYRRLLLALKEAEYGFQTFACFLEEQKEKAVVLRHDVDAKKLNSLQFARIQAEDGIRGTYYFRIVPQSFDEEVIREIAHLGHEIGYHYETMDTARGDADRAWDEFRKNLEIFREIAPVKTICMHGSPLSKYDNRSLWEKYDYKSLGLTGEPYLDLDFSKVMYLTDTGRRWDGEKVSVRDKVRNEERRTRNEERTKSNKIFIPIEAEGTHSLLPEPWTLNPTFHTTNDIIKAAIAGNLHDQIMFTFHPQRWTDKPIPWVKELLWQNVKNGVKRIIVR